MTAAQAPVVPMTKRERRMVRRAQLENKFVRIISHADHPLVALAKQAPAGLTKSQARRWARNKAKHARGAR